MHRSLLPAPLFAALVCLQLLGACALPGEAPAARASRAPGEGFAGVGERVLQISVPDSGGSWYQGIFGSKPLRSTVDLRYMGLDSAGRAVFLRHDGDLRAEAPDARAATPAGAAALADPRTQEIVLDLRLARQIHVQGKIVEVIEATNTGVVFRLY